LPCTYCTTPWKIKRNVEVKKRAFLNRNMSTLRSCQEKCARRKVVESGPSPAPVWNLHQ
jgi:hypothetical protein